MEPTPSMPIVVTHNSLRRTPSGCNMGGKPQPVGPSPPSALLLYATAIPTLPPLPGFAEGSLRKCLPKVRNDELGLMAGLPWFQQGRRDRAPSPGIIPATARVLIRLHPLNRQAVMGWHDASFTDEPRRFRLHLGRPPATYRAVVSCPQDPERPGFRALAPHHGPAFHANSP